VTPGGVTLDFGFLKFSIRPESRYACGGRTQRYPGGVGLSEWGYEYRGVVLISTLATTAAGLVYKFGMLVHHADFSISFFFIFFIVNAEVKGVLRSKTCLKFMKIDPAETHIYLCIQAYANFVHPIKQGKWAHAFGHSGILGNNIFPLRIF